MHMYKHLYIVNTYESSHLLQLLVTSTVTQQFRIMRKRLARCAASKLELLYWAPHRILN